MADNPYFATDLPDRDAALLAFFLGPVQPFIAGARTVRDLWTGSYLLAWLTFAAMRKVRDSGARLMSPSIPADHPLLWLAEKEGAPPNGITTPCIPNRFVARLPAGRNPQQLARDCEHACREEWAKICEKVRSQVHAEIDQAKAAFSVTVNGRPVDLLAAPWDRLWGDQVASFFEVRTVVLLPGQLSNELRSQLLDPVPLTAREVEMSILFGMMDARKSVRHVPPYKAEGDLPQKCTLLGTYEQMGPAPLDESRAFWEVFAKHVQLDGTHVREGERLCAVSVVKRFAWPAYFAPELRLRVDELSYSDTATVAAARWLPSETEAPEEGVNWRKLRGWSGQWLHWRKPDQEKDEKEPSRKVWEWIQKRKKEQGNPPAYYAILMADGDNLGSTIAIKGERVSVALTHFALKVVRDLVESDEYGGELIYSGGDDTLALLPTETAVACARAVQMKYEENWKQYFPEEPKSATISTGIVVVHYKEDLRFALDVARNAEHAAKLFGRDALALAVCRRSGEHTAAVLGWEQACDVQALVDVFRNDISNRWTYKLRALLPTFESMPWECFEAELRRLLARVEGFTTEARREFTAQVLKFTQKYLAENQLPSRKRPADKALEAYVMADFITLCQSASFLARGEGHTMTTTITPWQGLRLDPLDVLFFRDGRPFDAASRVTCGLPNPQTLAGALRTALLARTGFKFQAFAKSRLRLEVQAALKVCGAPEWVVTARFRGPWLALAREGKPIEPLLALPALLAQKVGGGWLRAEPRQARDLPGWEDEQNLNDTGQLLPLWRKGKPDTKASGALTLRGLRAFLANENFSDGEFFKPGEVYDFDHRTGIGIDMQTLTSAEGEIYGIRLLSLKPRVREESAKKDDHYHKAVVCLYAEVFPAEGAPDLKPYLAEPVPFGGEGKYVHVDTVTPCLWPVIDAKLPRSLWYLATPAFLGSDPARLAIREGLTLRAAASGAGVAVSGWDVARNGPRSTRFAVPAGAVYFVEGSVTADGPFNLDREEAAEGWGFALQGTW